MQTYSHVIINSAAGKYLEKRGIRPVYWALALGSLMPDVPLTVLTILFVNQQGGFNRPIEEVFGPAYDAMYFEDPLWITGHSMMHAPLMVALWLALGWFFGVRQGRGWGQWLLWFAVGNALHTALDIPTHHHDGPLLLFPFNWAMRFQSPVSYWDPAYHGQIFTVFEHALDVLLLVYFGGQGLRWLRKWRSQRTTPAEA